jgi:hypothetical protein
MKYRLMHDALFCDDTEFITLKKGSIYSAVHYREQSHEIKDLIRQKKMKGKHTERWDSIFADGRQRVMMVGRDIQVIIENKNKTNIR